MHKHYLEFGDAEEESQKHLVTLCEVMLNDTGDTDFARPGRYEQSGIRTQA